MPQQTLMKSSGSDVQATISKTELAALEGRVRAGLKSFMDVGKALATHALTLTGSSSVQVEYPPGSFQLASVGYVFNGGSSGIDVAWRYYGSYQTWFVEG